MMSIILTNRTKPNENKIICWGFSNKPPATSSEEKPNMPACVKGIITFFAIKEK